MLNFEIIISVYFMINTYGWSPVNGDEGNSEFQERRTFKAYRAMKLIPKQTLKILSYGLIYYNLFSPFSHNSNTR